MIAPELRGKTTFRTRLAAVARWSRRRLSSTRHEYRVMGTALRLFDATSHLHGLRRRERRLLKLAALLHDVGRCQGAPRHNVKGARLIAGADSLPLKRRERRAIRFLTRYHRGRAPAARDYAAFADNAFSMRVLLGILRAADALDSRRLTPPTLAIKLRDNQLEIRCSIHRQWRRARRTFRRRQKYLLLAESLDLKVRVRLRRCSMPSLPERSH